jgi:hypothetical protein
MFRRSISLAAAISVVLVIVNGLWLAPSTSHAASGPDCTWYDYQSDAQYDLDQVLENYPTIIETFRPLDEDRDGVACPGLPARPEILEESQRARGHFDPGFEYIGIEASGYSAWYEVKLAGVSLDERANDDAHDAECADLVSNEAIASLFALPDGVARQYYLESATSDPLPAGDDEGRFAVTATAWTVVDDPSAPVLINTWLVRNGLAFVDSDTVRGALERGLEEAQASAIDEGLGVWGACTLPDALTAHAAEQPGRVLQESGSGDHVVTFAIATDGTYLVTLDVAGGPSVFVAVDVYTMAGEWLPALSITTAERGEFTAAAYLAPGEYYAQVKAVGEWRLTIALLE